MIVSEYVRTGLRAVPGTAGRRPPARSGLALAGLLIAVAGALLPASWVARISTASALRTE